MKKTTKRDHKREGEKWFRIAAVYGFNKLALDADVLGDKVYFRILRDAAELDLAAEGVTIERSPETEQVVMRLDHGPGIVFFERDIELMRKAVADYDAKKAATR